MNIKKFFPGLMAVGIAFSLLCQTAVFAEEQGTGEDTSQDTVSAVSTNAIPGWPQGTDISSTAAIVMEDSTNTILYAKNMDQPLFPASTVKIMTTLLALENSQLTDSVTMTETGVSGVTDGGVNISAQLDETFTMEQCLYAIMLASANDIALQVAEHVGGSVENFVAMMNARAQELGCTNTLFTNPTGLPDENQHITAHDMALIMQAAMQNDAFRTIASAVSYTIPATNTSGGERALSNNFQLMNTSSPSYYQGCLGGKEGFTSASGSTLVCAAERNGSTLIAVILQGASEQTEPEAVTLLDYGFNNFHEVTLGSDDFNLLDGGIVFIPITATEADLTIQDGEASDDQYTRQYFYSDVPVGTATMAVVKENIDTTLIETSQKNLQAAENFTVNKSIVPYCIIGGVFAVLFVLLIILMTKVIKA